MVTTITNTYTQLPGNTLETIASVVTAVGTCVAAGVAFFGVNVWKNQLKYNLARRYLKAVYKIRDSIKDVRNPLILNAEINAALKEYGEEDEKNYKYAVYGSRWKKVIEASSELDVEVQEAEVLWGKQAADVQEDLRKCIRELYAALTLFIQGYPLPEQKDIIYDHSVPDVEEDAFTKKMNNAVGKVEAYMRKHLK